MNNQENQLKLFKIFSLVLLVAVIVLSVLFATKTSKPAPQTTTANLSEKAKPVFESKIDKSFDFPVKKGSKDKISIKIERADVVKLITAQGKPLVPKTGGAFLLFYLQIQNNLTSSLNVTSQDFFRLVDENNNSYAPDFYNTAVLVPAISVKSDQVGFVVKDGQKDFKLQVGEIDGEKQIVEIKF